MRLLRVLGCEVHHGGELLDLLVQLVQLALHVRLHGVVSNPQRFSLLHLLLFFSFVRIAAWMLAQRDEAAPGVQLHLLLKGRCAGVVELHLDPAVEAHAPCLPAPVRVQRLLKMVQPVLHRARPRREAPAAAQALHALLRQRRPVVAAAVVRAVTGVAGVRLDHAGPHGVDHPVGSVHLGLQLVQRLPQAADAHHRGLHGVPKLREARGRQVFVPVGGRVMATPAASAVGGCCLLEQLGGLFLLLHRPSQLHRAQCTGALGHPLHPAALVVRGQRRRHFSHGGGGLSKNALRRTRCQEEGGD
mmetsp:Transcript_35217/g.83926  ORF Transcript_35217/g.83926 Transcript_35217/m.83926 type:complete len:302 (+) Transcript_35217:514-1419(+)